MLVRRPAFWRERSARDRGVLALLFSSHKRRCTRGRVHVGNAGRSADARHVAVHGVGRATRVPGIVVRSAVRAASPARRGTSCCRRVDAGGTPRRAFSPARGRVGRADGELRRVVGRFSPAARYLVPVLPFCAAAVAWSLERPLFRRVVLLGAAVQVADHRATPGSTRAVCGLWG